MVERQDIDALLIGSLYGELSPAEEARLQAHLESHPADRAVLADLTHAREVVRESRILKEQAEPPQQISALLLQEAAKRAPKPAREQGEGWFARLVASLRHPAFAAAAMLVLVVGIGAIMYSRDEMKFAEQTKSSAPEPLSERADTGQNDGFTAGAPSGTAATQSTPSVPSADEADAAGGSSYEVQLADTFAAKDAEGKKAEAPSLDPPKQRPGKVATRDRGLELNTEGPAPKELPSDLDAAPAKKTARKAAPAKPSDALESELSRNDDQLQVAGGATAPRAGTTGAAAGAGAPARDQRSFDAPAVAAPEPAPPPPPAATATVAQDKAKVETPEMAWAKNQHAALVAAVNTKDCDKAAKLAVTLSSRAAGYYAQNVQNDRRVKGCRAHMDSATERAAAERAKNRSRSAPAATSK